MSPQAKVTSIDAIEAFRSRLVVYLAQARAAVEEVSSETVRMRLWLENDQRTLWENQLRRRVKQWQEAQQVVFSARLSSLKMGVSVEQLALHRAKRAVEEAEDKLRVIKRWRREFDGCVQPPLKQMEKLHTVLSSEMVKGVASLTETLNALAAYAELKGPGAVAEGVNPAPSAAATGTDTSGGEAT